MGARGFAGSLAAVLAGLALGVVVAPSAIPVLTGRPVLDPVARAIRADLQMNSDPVARFYRDRSYAPLWVAGDRIRPEAGGLMSVLTHADEDDLNPAVYRPTALAAVVGEAQADPDPEHLAAADVALSRAFAAYASDLHRPVPAARMAWIDPAASQPPLEPAAILDAAARAPSLGAALASVRRMNPIYVSLRSALASRRGRADAALIAANLERARALPPDLGKRYLLVDTAAQTLWWYADGVPRGSMRVVVGRNDNQTPSMIGVLRYALFNPYWNVPPDLVRDEIAPAVLRQGSGYLSGKRLEALADFSADAARVEPTMVDWRAVASGTQILRMRQSPGPTNMMGQVKFMMPNPLGIYLHDTPSKGLFGASERTDSHGCVRLENAQGLAEWLWAKPLKRPVGADARVDLPAPVPVYIVYLTVMPGPGGLTVTRDIYGRDPALESEVAERNGSDLRPGMELLSWTAERPLFPY